MTQKQKIKKLAQAVAHIEKAIALLAEVNADKSTHSFLVADAGHYKNELSELLSCDHGQAGLKVFSNNLTQRVAEGFFNYE